MKPHRILVSLPDVSVKVGSTAPAGEEVAADMPPAKRTRTAGAFSGFNSILPAPKNTGISVTGKIDVANTSGFGRSRGVGLGRGVSLRTGAAPAFSRDRNAPEVENETYSTGTKDTDVAQMSVVEPAREEVMLVGQPTMFKPLSVGRKLPKKKKIPPSESSNANSSLASSGEKVESQQSCTQINELWPKSKQCLFSANENALHNPSSMASSSGDYEPVSADIATEMVSHEQRSTLLDASQEGLLNNSSAPQPNNLQSLADELALTPAQRRQLFGRSGKPSDAQVAQFSLSAEYAHNNELIANQATAPAHNPVRSIAPGKHSLQQLLNAASNQKDALEESFATGRNNKRVAGSRYGW